MLSLFSRFKLKYGMAYFFMLPAIAIGSFAMILHGVDKRIWLQNILFWFVSSILGTAFVSNKSKTCIGENSFASNVITAVSVIVLLLSTFLFDGLYGVHRWIVLGPIRLNIANAFLPLLIISLWSLSQKQRTGIVCALAGITLLVLLLQPDASQVSAFACASIMLLWKNTSGRFVKLFYFIALAAMLASWILSDNLAPVPYVEQILFLLLDINVFWFVLGIASLVLLVSPFLLFSKSHISVSLGVYFAVTILATFLGNFPMPVMGYGLSPMIGYSIAITLLILFSMKAVHK